MTETLGAHGGPVPATLPGIEGFYCLTRDGDLGRYRADGGFVVEKELSAALSDKIDLLLRAYRRGNGDAAIALVMADTQGERPWRCASLVFSDNALHQYYRTSNDPDAGLTAFQKRNKTKSLFQGMEVLLDARDKSEPPYPVCCPILFAPEVGDDVLARRYGVEAVDAKSVLEVLNLMAPLAPHDRRHSYLTGMIMEMQRTRIAPEMRSGPELVLAATEGAAARNSQPAGPAHFESPWSEAEGRDHNVSYNDGDPVTYWLLGLFSPFNELNDLQRQFVARGYKVSKLRAGTTLIERGSQEDLSVYLIEGIIELEAFDGKKIEITGGTRRATLPISQLRPHAYTVRAATDVTVILISQKMIRDITRITTTYRNRAGIEVSEMDSLPDGLTGG